MFDIFVIARVLSGERIPRQYRRPEATREGQPKYKKDQLNSDYIKNSVIPPCKDAKNGEICY